MTKFTVAKVEKKWATGEMVYWQIITPDGQVAITNLETEKQAENGAATYNRILLPVLLNERQRFERLVRAGDDIARLLRGAGLVAEGVDGHKEYIETFLSTLADARQLVDLER